MFKVSKCLGNSQMVKFTKSTIQFILFSTACLFSTGRITSHHTFSNIPLKIVFTYDYTNEYVSL